MEGRYIGKKRERQGGEEGRRENTDISGVKELAFLPKMNSFVGT